MHPTFHPNFVQFLKEFNDSQDYFECHELLEEYWKEISPRQKKHPLTALILLSTSMYHWRRGNIAGAIKTMKTSIKRFEETIHFTFFEKIDYVMLLNNMTTSLTRMQEGSAFQSFLIPINDRTLLSLTDAIEINSREELHYLIHKHMLRDRSEILEAREKSKKRRSDSF